MEVVRVVNVVYVGALLGDLRRILHWKSAVGVECDPLVAYEDGTVFRLSLIDVQYGFTVQLTFIEFCPCHL